MKSKPCEKAGLCKRVYYPAISIIALLWKTPRESIADARQQPNITPASQIKPYAPTS